MKIIDRYLLKHLLLPFVFCFVSLFCIFVLIDLFDSIGDYATAHAPLKDIARIYAIMLGQVAPLIIPFAFFLACVYLLTNLSSHKELVALMAAGVSLARLVIPFVCLAVSLSAVEYYLYLKLAPTATVRREALMRQWSRKHKPMEVFNGVVYKNPATNVMWYIHQLDTKKGAISQAEICVPNDRGGDQEKYFVAQGNYRGRYWDLVGIRKITFHDGVASPPENLGRLDARFLTESPRQIAAVLLQPDGYPWPELYRFITAPYQPSAPRMAPYKTEHFRRLTDPLLAPLLCLFAFALSVAHDRNSRAGAIVNCMLILVSLFIVAKICVAMGNRNRLTPEMAGWFPILVYGGAAIGLFIYRVGLWWEFVYVMKTNGLWFGREQWRKLLRRA
ncbi:MAG: LptF/LptG family permease [Verrucomicrobiales bacterium]|jgi:lipopolysaccharide export system permease protein|nr:LptF/LptG family permease [Verrucomicrobiales bacterium]